MKKPILALVALAGLFLLVPLATPGEAQGSLRPFSREESLARYEIINVLVFQPTGGAGPAAVRVGSISWRRDKADGLYGGGTRLTYVPADAAAVAAVDAYLDGSLYR